MIRLLIWGGAALALHAVLLLIPIYDNPLESSASSGGVSVHIQTNQRSGKQNSARQVSQETQQANLADAGSTQPKMVSEVKSISDSVILQGEFSDPIKINHEKISIKQLVVPDNLKSGVKFKETVSVARSTTNKPKAVANYAIESSAEITQEAPENIATKGAASSVESTLDLTKSDNHKNDFSRRTRLISARPASKNKPKYPRRAIIRNQQGDVKVELLIKHNGLVEEAILVESSGFPMLDKSVMKFVNKERFIAALENGAPVASTQLYTYRFVLK